MLIFLDESGDAGLKLKEGSSALFVIALVVFDENEHAERTKEIIANHRMVSQLSSTFEFKFAQMKDQRRLQFLQAVQGGPYRLRVMVVDKSKLTDTRNIEKAESFYNFFAHEALKRNSSVIRAARLRIDGSGSREFKGAFSGSVRSIVGDGIIKNTKFLDSRKDSLIQLADMVAGSAARAYRPTKPDGTFLKMLAPKIDDLWEY